MVKIGSSPATLADWHCALSDGVQLQIADCYEALGSVTQADPDQG